MSQIYIAEIEAWDPALGAVRTLRYCTGTGYTSGASDTPAHTWYEPRIQQPANLQREASSAKAGRVGFGELVLVNVDGGLDALVDYGFDGRRITIKLGVATPWGATWRTVLVGTMARADFSWGKVSIVLRDRQAELAKPLQASTYAGTNALPAGVEGTASDIKGQRKPRLYGWGHNLAPVCCNTSRLIYQVSDQSCTIDAVYDRGVALTAGADYTSEADMQANGPALGQYRAWPAGGMFRLGSSPTGQITCDAHAGANAAARTAAQLIKAVMLDAGIAAGDINAGDVAALDAANSAECGFWVTSDEQATAVIDALAESVGAWWGVDRLGQFRMGRFEAPSGTPVATITEVEVLSIDRVADSVAPVPTYKATVTYKPFGVTQSSDLAGSVTDARRAELATAVRTLVATDAAVLTAHPFAGEVSAATRLVVQASAQAEVDRLLALYKVRRDTLSVRVALDADLSVTLDLGAVVSVKLNRFGYAAGRLMGVTQIRTDLRSKKVELTLWG